MECVCGAMAGVLAATLTNPLDVVKTGLQLQGELKAKGEVVVPYRNTVHAFYTIARHDGMLKLQKGLVPALWYQVFLNGTRLGIYGTLDEWNWTKNKDGTVNLIKTAGISIFAGCLGNFLGSPFYLIKTHLQSQGGKVTAVGYQHMHIGTLSAFKEIYSHEGVRGLWRGTISSFPRSGFGSATQLTTFTTSKELLVKHQLVKEDSKLTITFIASMMSGFVLAVFMTPFDVVRTRLCNQGVDAHGKGILYSGIVDCFIKISRHEGITGLYKGFGPSYLRAGPHSLLCLVFWDFFRDKLI